MVGTWRVQTGIPVHGSSGLTGRPLVDSEGDARQMTGLNLDGLRKANVLNGLHPRMQLLW
jgi:hypothetical protein